ncbi:UNVERIFIED_CONTAM: hypothetical protein Sradi_0842500 [Sesamum radiatum]|uniref:Secreted protein n=1 Tax=Sesamum radiatum TaxID=300843 RepID=A0AAW2V3B6_SESRA
MDFFFGSSPSLFIIAMNSFVFGFSNLSPKSSTTTVHSNALARAVEKASLFSFLLILTDQSFGLGPKMTPPLGEGECAGNHDGRDRFSFEDKASDRHHGPPRG